MIPVFLHIPKCGGTYMSFMTSAIFMESLEWVKAFKTEIVPGTPEFLEHLKKFNIDNLRKVERRMVESNKKILTIVDKERNPQLVLWFKPKTTKGLSPFWIEMSFENFLKQFNSEEYEIFFVSIKPSGIQNLEKIFNVLKQPLNAFTMFRDPFEIEQSTYFYLQGFQSKHENTHKTIKSQSFEEYLNSYETADSWLIRQLQEIPNEQIINEEHYNNVLNILKDCTFEETKNAWNFFKNIMHKCHNISVNIENIIVNETKNKPKDCLQNYNSQTQNFFLERKKYDYKLYKKITS